MKAAFMAPGRKETSTLSRAATCSSLILQSSAIPPATASRAIDALVAPLPTKPILPLDKALFLSRIECVGSLFVNRTQELCIGEQLGRRVGFFKFIEQFSGRFRTIQLHQHRN